MQTRQQQLSRDEQLLENYPEKTKTLAKSIAEKRGGKLSNIHKQYLCFPEGLQAHYQFYRKVMLKENLPLSRQERQFIAMKTSKTNQCRYCLAHHQQAYQNFSEILSQQKQEVLTDLSITLTKWPQKAYSIKDSFLKIKGYGDKQWKHAVMIVSYFNMANRIAFGCNLQIQKGFEDTCK